MYRNQIPLSCMQRRQLRRLLLRLDLHRAHPRKQGSRGKEEHNLWFQERASWAMARSPDHRAGKTMIKMMEIVCPDVLPSIPTQMVAQEETVVTLAMWNPTTNPNAQLAQRHVLAKSTGRLGNSAPSN